MFEYWEQKQRVLSRLMVEERLLRKLAQTHPKNAASLRSNLEQQKALEVEISALERRMNSN
jgi:hypothetical protein